ncbi:MAG: hypothetical protein U0790_26385 [Isosphaeraceae bacterium]
MLMTPGRNRTPLKKSTLLLAALIAAGAGLPAPGQTGGQAPSVQGLLRLGGPELEALYRQGRAVGIPPGRVRGTAILAPGARRNEVMALGTRMVWQGKVFESGNTTAVNRFFGLPVVRANVYQAQSLHDGAAALVLDYSQTSRVYARYRDEIREVAPGLFLGLMYDVTTSPPHLRMYFALESHP